MEHQQEILSEFLKNIVLTGKLNRLVYKKGKQLFEDGSCLLMTSSTDSYEYLVKDDYQDFQTRIIFQQDKLAYKCSCLSSEICSHALAAANQASQDMSRSLKLTLEGVKKYTREGMMKRVLEERENRSKEEKFRLDFSDNIYGEHQITNEQGKLYEISFYDFDKRSGYCSCPDYQTNKLETCKHLMYAFDKFDQIHKRDILPSQSYPFLEIFRHPSFDYQIAWYYPNDLHPDIQEILNDFFDEQHLYKVFKFDELHVFANRIQQFKTVKIRPEVLRFIQDYYEEKSLKATFYDKTFNDSYLLQQLYPFQKEGIEFLGRRKGSILADEIGTGKTVQAIGAALYKKEILGFSTVKILSPDYLLDHWKYELKKWLPEALASSFILESFEDIHTDEPVDILIIDEAQKITDYDSGLLQKLHKISFKHILLITDSKIENSLIKFYAMTGLIDKYLLTPLWELSYNHCLFNPKNQEEIIGYYNLDKISEKLKEIYLRREKERINQQLPETIRVLIPIPLNDTLNKNQYQLSANILQVFKKKATNPYDLIQLKSYLKQLIELGKYTLSSVKNTATSPKLNEFRHVIRHKLILNKKEPIVIFAEDNKLQQQIKKILEKEHKTVIIIKEGETKFNENIQFFIVNEDLQKDLPSAQHFIYYHLPSVQNAINERIKLLNNRDLGFKQNKIYLLQTSNSFESVLYQWQENKLYISQQLSDYLVCKDISKPMSLRLQEEINHEINTLHQFSKPKVTKPLSPQMDLFGETVIVPKTEKNKIEGDNILEPFFKNLAKFYAAYNNLNSKQKGIIFNGDIEIKEEKDEIIIRIKPSRI